MSFAARLRPPGWEVLSLPPAWWPSLSPGRFPSTLTTAVAQSTPHTPRWPRVGLFRASQIKEGEKKAAKAALRQVCPYICNLHYSHCSQERCESILYVHYARSKGRQPGKDLSWLQIHTHKPSDPPGPTSHPLAHEKTQEEPCTFASQQEFPQQQLHLRLVAQHCRGVLHPPLPASWAGSDGATAAGSRAGQTLPRGTRCCPEHLSLPTLCTLPFPSRAKS